MAYVPISQELHVAKSWAPHPSMLFAKKDIFSPLLVSDLSSAVQALPIAFIKRGESFTLVVLTGLKHEENLLVSPQGEWIADFMPSVYRTSPFELLPTPDGYTLGIDESCLRNKGEGQALFNDDGTIADATTEIFDRVLRINETRNLTQYICTLLANFNLIKPWNIKLNEGSHTQHIEGIYLVDEQAMNELPDESFSILRHANALPVVYAQLYSMKNINFLGRLAETSRISNKVESGSETFNFSGL
jgi:hypothetical protein